MKLHTKNPYNGEYLASYNLLTDGEIKKKLAKSQKAYALWKNVRLSERCGLLKRVSQLLKNHVEEYAELITKEMGKPITESRAEVKKCALVCDYYADNAEDFLADEEIKTEASKSFVRHSPIGTILAIMPWNYPFWQVFRFAAPTLTAGNTGVLKHASNVLGCAEVIEQIFTKAGYPDGVFQHLIFGHDSTEAVIAHPAVKAVSLTGSERAGSEVAALAGKYIKKSLLELGGSNAYIVLQDADLQQSVKNAVIARMMNCGQSCISAKRFIIEAPVYDEFVEQYIAAVKELKIGDPMQETTQIATLARIDLAEALQKQIKQSVAAGAVLLYGGEQKGTYHQPTVLGDVVPGMAAFDEETFGPMAPFIKAKDLDHALELATQTRFGLGATLCTSDMDKAMFAMDMVADGSFFVNEPVRSNPRLPFGGSGISGYGRELSKDGIMEFINRKTVLIK